MARSRTINERLYQPGIYGPFAVDQFTRDDCNALVATFTRVNWPQANELARITIEWSTGQRGIAVIGFPIDGDAEVNVQFNVPRVGNAQNQWEKRPVLSAQVTAEVLQAIRTAITITAV